MIWILATRGAVTKLIASPYTETAIEGVHSAVYEPGIEPVPAGGRDSVDAALGTFGRGAHRASGFVFSYHGFVAETLLAVADEIDLIVRYRGSGQKRKRTLSDIIFVGDATVTVPAQNTGVSELIGVPFRVQIAAGETLADHITDTLDV